jgi:GDPmannose 4,6-dehydratase
LGQDGWYLSEFLQGAGYEVVGTRRGTEDPRRNPPGVRVVYGDVTDAMCIRDVIEAEQPDEIYNLAAVTHVGDSFSAQAVAGAVNYNGACNVIDAGVRVGAKVYQAGTSELFGDSPPPQHEDTPMRPRSPYAVAKLGAHWAAKNARARGGFVCSGLLFNHESPRRTPGFVTQKVAMAVNAITRGDAESVTLGNLDAGRDWGHAWDYVRAMWLMMQQPKPDEYVVATGRMHTVRELCEQAFWEAGLSWRDHVRTDDSLRRPLEVERLCGDPRKIMALGWKPVYTFETLVREMVRAASER